MIKRQIQVPCCCVSYRIVVVCATVFGADVRFPLHPMHINNQIMAVVVAIAFIASMLSFCLLLINGFPAICGVASTAGAVVVDVVEKVESDVVVWSSAAAVAAAVDVAAAELSDGSLHLTSIVTGL